MSFLRSVVALLSAFVLLGMPGVAVGHTRPHLSMKRGEAMIRANAMLDEPMQVILSACHRDSARAVSCWVTEVGAHTLIYDNGEAITMKTLSYEGMAG